MSVEPVRHADQLTDETREAAFSVHVTGPLARSRRSLKHNDTFAVLDGRGDIDTSAGTDGLFQCDTRFLSRLELLINGVQPLLLASNLSDDNFLLTIDLTNPDIVVDGHVLFQKDMVHIVRSIFIWNETIHQRIGVRNHGVLPVMFDLTVKFDNDFADLFEVRGSARKKRGLFESKIIGSKKLQYLYRGLDNVVRKTTIDFHPQPAMLDAHRASYRVNLAAGVDFSLCVAVSCNSTKRQRHQRLPGRCCRPGGRCGHPEPELHRS